MSITTTAHLNFRGTARQALELYQTVFGGRIVSASYSDFGMPKDTPGADKIVFSQLEAENGFRVMAYDIPGHNDTDPQRSPGRRAARTAPPSPTAPSFLSVRGETPDEVKAYWEKLSIGAVIIESLAASAWSPGFGTFTDRFGIAWVLDVRAGHRG
ncbi:MAG TPA: VOC family protein [Gryllotalpicola sp.]